MPCQWLTESVGPATILGGFHEPVRAWWQAHFAAFSLPQRLAIPAIAQGRHTLICAPTGTGKTLCAFISILSDLLARQDRGTLADAVDTVYISPLRALGSDIARNLLGPLREIRATTGGGADGNLEASIRVGQRTGDTTSRQRAAMARLAPHILITTPESLALCLASASMRRHLCRVRRIIIDELHALVPNKRGTDLMLSVERLSDLVLQHDPDAPPQGPQRIGLSATIAPLERIAEFLVGSPQTGRWCAIADAAFKRPLELRVASVFGSGVNPFITTAAINRGVYDFLEKTIRAHRTTLVFTNVRSATERVTFALRRRFAPRAEATAGDIICPEHIQAHHSSLDRDLRLDVERRLKAGELRCVVCSTSLELGIDIGSIDHVVLLNSPKSVARGLQRVGRSGHRLDGIARGTLLPTVPADLLEALVTAQAMRNRRVGEIDYPRNCLDVLAQHLIGMALQASADGITLDHAWRVVRRCASYGDLSRERFDDVVRFLTAGDSTGDPDLRPKLAIEGSGPTARLLPLRKSLGGLYAQNVGTIAQEGQVKVRVVDGAVIGTVEEAFAQMLKAGDRFVLAGKCVAMVGTRGMSVEVVPCAGQTPTVPRWFSGMMSMDPGLTQAMRAFRAAARAVAPSGRQAIARMLMRRYGAGEDVARVAAGYLDAQHRFAAIPVEGELLVERLSDQDNPLGPATVLVFHTLIGRAANDALARTVAWRMGRRWGGAIQPEMAKSGRGGLVNVAGAAVVVDDHAFGIWLPASSALRQADRTFVRSVLSPTGFKEDLLAAVEASELFVAQFRHTAIRAHALLRNKFGRRRFIGQLHAYAGRLHEWLKSTCPDHLLLAETRRTVMEDILAAPVARRYLESLTREELRLVDLPAPSPFAFGLFAAGGRAGRGRDRMQLADTADFLMEMYQKVQSRLPVPSRSVSAAQFELFT